MALIDRYSNWDLFKTTSFSISSSGQIGFWEYLEDHPMTCKWLITMVSCSP